jgi:hypothetical protein
MFFSFEFESCPIRVRFRSAHCRFSAPFVARLYGKRPGLTEIDTFSAFFSKINFGGPEGYHHVDFGPPRSFKS